MVLLVLRAGLPQNWTSPTATVTKESFNDLFKPLQAWLSNLFRIFYDLLSRGDDSAWQGKQEKVLSLNSGVGGLELSLRQRGTQNRPPPDVFSTVHCSCVAPSSICHLGSATRLCTCNAEG